MEVSLWVDPMPVPYQYFFGFTCSLVDSNSIDFFSRYFRPHVSL